MRHTYDNSAANLRNPHQPPRRVYFGPQSTDEMGELWLQVVPRDPKELPALQRAHKNFFDLETISYYEAQLRQNPNDARGHTALGKILGPMGKLEESIRHFQTAIELQPDELEAHYYLGLSLYTIREWADARKEFEAVLRLDPNYGKAHDGLGLIFLKLNQPAQAEIHFQRALEINPDDKAAQDNLNLLRRNRTVRP